MTPTELEDYARSLYNATGDTFFTQAEIQNHIYAACMVLAREAMCIERSYDATTTADQEEYAFPSNALGLKRIEVDGFKLMPITFRDRDRLVGANTTTLATGTPAYYVLWGESFYLYPIPDSALEMTVFTYNEPQPITTTSTLEVPTRFHLDIADYVVAQMALKDSEPQKHTLYMQKWERSVARAKALTRKMKRTDSFATVQNIDELPSPLDWEPL